MTLKELIEQRKKMKVTLLELAAYTGMTERYLGQLEDRAFRPNTGDLERIERALKKILRQAAENKTDITPDYKAPDVDAG